MSDFKLRFSDIFRYIVLGAVEALLCYFTLNARALSKLAKHLSFIPDDPIITVILALSAFYLAGYLTQMILQLFCNGNLMGTGLRETGLFIGRFPTFRLNRSKYPHWIYYSRRPDKVLDIYSEILETGADSPTKTEFQYANNLFQGIALSLIVFSFFAYTTPITFESVVKSIVVVFILCLIGHLSVKNNFFLCLNKSLIILVPTAITIAYAIKGDPINGTALGGGIFLCLCVAEQLSRRQIKRIDTLIKYANKGENEARFISTLKRNGVPTAFVLTRVSDSSFEFYKEQLDSIKAQIYPNIKAIVLIDRNSSRHDEFVAIIEEYRKNGLNISHYTSKGAGPSSLAYEIRNIFINYAGDNDVAISLDGDDAFSSPHVVSRIMGRIARTKANVCLLTFEIIGDTRHNYAKNHPNEIVKRIAEDYTEKGKVLKPKKLIKSNNAHLISTIGWIKCYRKDVLKRYQKLWDPYKDQLNKYSIYEDFPDINALLGRKTRICAVGTPSILFRKHNGSITTLLTPDNYQVHVTYYLKVAMQMCDSCDNLNDQARKVIKELFIPYKFVQYLNIVKIKTTKPCNEVFADYSPKQFYDNFVREVYGADKSMLDNGILNILKANFKLTETEPEGYYGADLPDSLKTAGPTLKDVADAYALK